MATRSKLDDFAYGLRSRHLEICEVLWEAIVEEGKVAWSAPSCVNMVAGRSCKRLLLSSSQAAGRLRFTLMGFLECGEPDGGHFFHAFSAGVDPVG